MVRRLTSAGRLLAVGMVLAIVLTACGSEGEQRTGVVVNIDSPSIGRVDSFELLTPDGERLIFDTSELKADADFPVAHLSEHQLLSDPIDVTYRVEGDRLVVTHLEDAS